jgi:hypothetical protein
VDASELCGLVAEPDRLAVFAAVVLGARTPDQVAAATGLSPREVAPALRRLQGGGLVSDTGDGLVAHGSAFKTVARAADSGSPLDPDPQRAAVLRSFIRHGRLTHLPAAHGKRRIVLEHLAAAFEPGVRYPEREVNATLQAWHDDYATTRRYLVDEGLLTRDAGVYWRTGGPVPI